jgi:hypothetical protein
LGTVLLRKREEIRNYLLSFLKEVGPSTTAELIENVPLGAGECIDKTRAQVMALLLSLEDQKCISKTLSKEKKGIVWSLVE